MPKAYIRRRPGDESQREQKKEKRPRCPKAVGYIANRPESDVDLELCLAAGKGEEEAKTAFSKNPIVFE